MLYPLCIGMDYAEESVAETTKYQKRHVLPRGHTTVDEWYTSYEAWKNQRFRELGYLW